MAVVDARELIREALAELSKQQARLAGIRQDAIAVERAGGDVKDMLNAALDEMEGAPPTEPPPEPPEPGEPAVMWRALPEAWQRFDGTKDAIMVFDPGDGMWEGRTEGTLTMWAVREPPRGPGYPYAGLISIEGDQRDLVVWVEGQPARLLTFRMRNAFVTTDLMGLWLPYEPVHLALTWASDEIAIWINGERIIAHELTFPPLVRSHSIVIGGTNRAKDEQQFGERLRNPWRGFLYNVELWDRRLTSGEIDTLLVKGAPDLPDGPVDPPIDPPPPPPPPPGPNGPDLPPAKHEVILPPGENVAQAAARAPAETRFVLRNGTWNATELVGLVPRNGQQFVAPDGAEWRGTGTGFAQCISGGFAHDVAFQGIRFTAWGGRGNAPKQANGRLQSEVGIIQPDSRGWPRRASAWIFLDLEFTDSPWMEGIKGGDFFQVHRCTFRELVIGFAWNGQEVRLSHSTAEDMNRAGAASHHHTGGLFKATGGRRNWAVGNDDPNALFPPRSGGHVWGCTSRNLHNTRGMWTDWDVPDLLIEDCEVDGCDFEGLVYEASAGLIARRITLKNCARKPGHPKWQGGREWGSALMLQNSRDCLIEDVTVHPGPHVRCAFSISHHNRAPGDPPGRVGTNAGHTVGPFTGTGNRFVDCRVSSSIEPALFQGIDGGFPPGEGPVRSSNRLEGLKRF